MGFMDLFKEKINLSIIAGGHVLPTKELPVAVQSAILTAGKSRGKVEISVPFAGKKEWTLTGIEWEESHARNVGTTAAGVIVGGLAGGIIGATAGAAIGGRRRDKSKAYITLVDKEGIEHELHINCDQQLYTKLSNMTA